MMLSVPRVIVWFVPVQYRVFASWNWRSLYFSGASRLPPNCTVVVRLVPFGRLDAMRTNPRGTSVRAFRSRSNCSACSLNSFTSVGRNVERSDSSVP